MQFIICANLQLPRTRSRFVVVAIGFSNSEIAVASPEGAIADGSLNAAIV